MERLPGFRDFYPDPLPSSDAWSAPLRQRMFQSWRNTARRYGFLEYDAPPLEPLELFTAKSGEEIVNQLYNFTDKGNREVALRPEMTPSLARMVAGHLRNYKKPLKWFAIPQLFRYERQQKGRLREHFQLNADILGEKDPAADAELIALLIDTLVDLGLTAEDFCVRLSSRDAWQQFFARRQEDAGKAYAFYQAIDKLDRDPPEQSRARLQELGFRLEEVQAFIAEAEPTPSLEAILQNLSQRGRAGYVRVDYGVIRGLAYYTGTVFEAFDRQGEFRAIAGGGRYDHLVKLISRDKVDLPALGFGMGDVVLLELLKARGKLPESESATDLFCLVEDESLRAPSLQLIQRLRSAGVAVDYPLTPAKPDKQFKRARELGVRYTVRLLASEPGRAALRNLASREESIVPIDGLAEYVLSVPRDPSPLRSAPSAPPGERAE